MAALSAYALRHLGDLAQRDGDSRAARHHYRGALMVFLQLHDSDGVTATLNGFMDLLRAVDEPSGLAPALEELAEACRDEGADDWAGQLHSGAERVRAILALDPHRPLVESLEACLPLQLERPKPAT